MDINPSYTAVGKLFEFQPIFFIPKYQRSYAWEEEPVIDFIKDFKSCFEDRSNDNPSSHFFGGILSVKHDVTGAVNQHKYEIIDGQQRLATITLLVSCIIAKYKELEVNAQEPTKGIIHKRIEKLSRRFLHFEQEVNMEVTNVETLTLSKTDANYFKELINGLSPNPERNSHHLIKDAHAKLKEIVQKITDSHDLVNDKALSLEVMQNAIDKDFTVLHMVTNTSKDAYRLFQVINDRGTSLTDGDLLRAKTLEIVEKYPAEQHLIESLWDKILCDEPSETEKYLSWVFESYTGKRAKPNALFDMYLDTFFAEHKKQELTQGDAARIYSAVKQTHEDILMCKQISDGQWPFEKKQPIMSWDRSRLSLIISELNHKLAIPLLLSATLLDHKEFSAIIQKIELIFFRYKLICNQHVTPLKKIYADESVKIRNNTAEYASNEFDTKLKNLIETRAKDEAFINGLSTLEYNIGGGSNKPLKYFLMTTEYYYQWYLSGANGSPECIDKSRVYDFAGTSIEHLYPQNAEDGDKDPQLELIKNSIGNLTILDPNQNSIGGNLSFVRKKEIYKKSSVKITSEIGELDQWGEREYNDHKKNLIEVALKVFKL